MAALANYALTGTHAGTLCVDNAVVKIDFTAGARKAIRLQCVDSLSVDGGNLTIQAGGEATELALSENDATDLYDKLVGLTYFGGKPTASITDAYPNV